MPARCQRRWCECANKIGTYGLAILCKYHNIPFYIAAPTSTVDIGCDSGAHIPIEKRRADEVLRAGLGTCKRCRTKAVLATARPRRYTGIAQRCVTG